MIRLSLDVQNSFIPIVRRCVRSFSTTRSFNDTRTARERKRQLRESTPFQMQGSGKHSERKQRVFVFGYKATGALGLGWTRQDESPYPMKIVSKPYNLTFFAKQQFKLLDVACGFGYTVFACKRSKHLELFGCGLNTESQLGFQQPSEIVEPQQPTHPAHLNSAAERPESTAADAADKADSLPLGIEIVREPSSIRLPPAPSTGRNFIALGCGRAHTVIATSDAVFSLGNNAFGQCGREVVEREVYARSHVVGRLRLPVDPQSVRQVVCGADNTLVLVESGEVYSCGLGADGQTGLGHFQAVAEPTLVRGALAGVRVVQLSCRGDTALAVSSDGELFGWGNAEYGQLTSAGEDLLQVHTPRPLAGVARALAAGERVTKAVAAGSSCAALTSAGRVLVWGYGLLGAGPKTDLVHADRPLPLPEPLFGRTDSDPECRVRDIDCGLTFFSAINANGELFTWGTNQFGQLGLGHRDKQFFPFRGRAISS